MCTSSSWFTGLCDDEFVRLFLYREALKLRLDPRVRGVLYVFTLGDRQHSIIGHAENSALCTAVFIYPGPMPPQALSGTRRRRF